MHFCIFPENILFPSKRAILTRKMLVQANHLTLLQSAMREMEMRDSNIVFLCSDGRITYRSTHFKIHSKFLQKILSETPTGLPEFVIHLPDIPKSHMSHLVSLMSQGSSNFSSRTLSNVDSLSKVINNILVTADLLGVQISNYGFDVADEGVANLNNIKKETSESEYCEIESVLIKSEIDHGKPDNNLHISPEIRNMYLDTSVDSIPEKEKSIPEERIGESDFISQFIPATREQQRREAFLERAKHKSLLNNQQNKSYCEIMPDEEIDIEGTNSVSGKNPAPSETKHNLNMSRGKLRKLIKQLEKKPRKKKIQRLKALGLLQDQSLQDLPLGPQWVAGPPPYSHGNVGKSSSPEVSAPMPDMRTSHLPHSPPIQPTQPRTTCDSLENVGNLYNNQQQREQETFSSASTPVFGKSLSLLKQKTKLNATFQ